MTNTFETKTKAVLAAISDNIIASPPTIEAMTDDIVAAAEKINNGGVIAASLRMPNDWGETLTPVARRMAELFARR